VAHMRRTFEVPNRPLETFAFVREFEHAAKWDPAVTDARRVDPGPVKLGTRFVLVAKPFDMKMPYQVTDFVPGKRIALEGQNDTYAWRDEILFEPAPSGGTVITYDARLDLKGLLGIGQPVLALVFSRAGDRAIDGIKRLLTQRWQGRPDVTPPARRAVKVVTPGEVERVVAMEDAPALRNLLITQGYHDLSLQLGRWMGTDEANWCTFGTWASKTAGRFIRDEEAPALLRGVLERHEEVSRHRERARSAGHDPVDLAADILGDVQAFIREGNKVVFADLALAFARFLEALDGLEARDDARVERFLATMPDGPSLPDEVSRGRDGRIEVRSRGGQTWLKKSLRGYYEAKLERDPRRRAELVLLASAYGGLHEQTRLQPYIQRSLDAPIDDVLGGKYPSSDRGVWGVIGSVYTHLVGAVRGAWEEFSTIAMMELKLPDGTVHLGSDLGRPPGSPLFPASLVRLDLPELVEVLRGFDVPIDGSHALDLFGGATRSAARDWVQFRERMRYIFTLFRSRQEDVSLLVAPFTLDQEKALREGKVPDGPLY
jgi:hypothetical protein